MRLRKPILIVLGVLAAVLIARALGLWTAEQIWPATQPPSTSTPPLVFAEDDLVFGPITDSEQIEQNVRLTNTTDAEVTVDHFETTCS